MMKSSIAWLSEQVSIDGRWKGTIVWRLSEGPMRTSELRRSIPGITERMLIRHLQELVKDGIIRRRDERSLSVFTGSVSTPPSHRRFDPIRR
jgi:HxlR-like helix-turn-helix